MTEYSYKINNKVDFVLDVIKKIDSDLNKNKPEKIGLFK
jgi:hypothetical protein